MDFNRSNFFIFCCSSSWMGFFAAGFNVGISFSGWSPAVWLSCWFLMGFHHHMAQVPMSSQSLSPMGAPMQTVCTLAQIWEKIKFGKWCFCFIFVLFIDSECENGMDHVVRILVILDAGANVDTEYVFQSSPATGMLCFPSFHLRLDCDETVERLNSTRLQISWFLALT